MIRMPVDFLHLPFVVVTTVRRPREGCGEAGVLRSLSPRPDGDRLSVIYLYLLCYVFPRERRDGGGYDDDDIT